MAHTTTFTWKMIWIYFGLTYGSSDMRYQNVAVIDMTKAESRLKLMGA
jgi:hypothetical protein